MLFFLQTIAARIRHRLSNYNAWSIVISNSLARSLGILVIAQGSGPGALQLSRELVVEYLFRHSS